MKRVLELRRQTESLKMIAQTIVEECLRLEGVSKPSNDNVTLIIISLADRWRRAAKATNERAIFDDASL